MVVERRMTKKFLEDAFAGESQAHVKYAIFAEQAEKEGYGNVAKLFRAIAFAELVHARNHLKALGNVESTAENLETAIRGESYEVDEMYPVFNKVAEFQGEKEAQKSTYYALSAEKIHVDLYKKAKEAVESGKDVEIEKVYICPVCGFTVVDEAPEFCPICGTKRDIFKQF
ncbi:rubrerythrin family protein [Archaeoglobus neptunius]|uniref:rubrerythrin family protein n=1 Tax=Archaeoglobus neptunius TaxID=2798580 RepID=UPI001E2DA1B8|nr:rubrerythrin family protein [Archaeoglobus neptunius]